MRADIGGKIRQVNIADTRRWSVAEIDTGGADDSAGDVDGGGSRWDTYNARRGGWAVHKSRGID